MLSELDEAEGGDATWGAIWWAVWKVEVEAEVDARREARGCGDEGTELRSGITRWLSVECSLGSEGGWLATGHSFVRLPRNVDVDVDVEGSR